MNGRLNKDIVGGLILVAVGVWIAWHAASSYPLGSLRRMGPGMFPAGMGAITAILGAIVAVQALFREVERADVRIWAPLFVLAGIAGFAIVIPLFGLIPAIFVVVIVSSFADLNVRPVTLAIMCVVLSIMVPLIFRVALGLQLDMVRWPF